METKTDSSPSPRRTLWIVVALVAAVVIVVEGIALLTSNGDGPFASKQVWSAVFVNNNQIFFGHIKSNNSNELDLVNVYYLQAAATPPAGTQASSASPALTINSLVGAQIQCPKDEVVINRTDILYTQTLQASSFVVSRLNALSQTPQNCFQPPAATATPVATAAPTPSPKAKP